MILITKLLKPAFERLRAFIIARFENSLFRPGSMHQLKL